jgi:sodium transport system permease protein
LAVALHPLVNVLQTVVDRVYPMNEELVRVLDRFVVAADNVWVLLLAVAVLPAVCEELAFRGFILSGLRHIGNRWTAIVISSVFFGMAHSIFQQSLIACLVGVVLGFIAIQSGSLWPCALFHLTHNSLGVLVRQWVPWVAEQSWGHWLVRDVSSEGQLYPWPVVTASVLASAAILIWFQRLPYERSAEESLQEAIDHQSAHWLPG